ncbi:PAS domain S-box protein [Chlorogloeopsis sp. ULAP02]|uniref:PAS domain S-box protein n=1 Tax=Chlorogloeopsis sp. ULAP02 TaxID=3107926 RepID=UPI0031369A46
MTESSNSFQRLQEYFAKIPLCVILVVPFVLQLLASVGVIGYICYAAWQRSTQKVANQVMKEVGDRVQHYLSDYLETPQLINRLNANAIRLEQIDINNSTSLERHFLQQIQTFNSVSSIHFSNPQGGYISAGNDERGLSVAFTDNFVKGTLYVYGVDSKGNRTKRFIYKQNYDASQRPFYQNAVKAGQPIWTSIYNYIPASMGLGIAASYPLYDQANQLQGVLSTDINLTKINKFLSNLNIFTQGEVLILERSGLIVASSTSELPFFISANQSQTRRLKAIESQDLLVRSTAQHLLSYFGDLTKIETPQQLQFDVKGKRLFLQVNPFRDRFNLDWLIVTVLPESDLIIDIDSNNQRILFLSGFTLVLAIGTGIVTACWIALPMRRLQKAAKAITKGDLAHPIATGGVGEVAQLAQAFQLMANQLDSSFQALKASEHKFAILLSNVPIGISVFDAQENPILINKAGEEILGRGLVSDIRLAQHSQEYQIYVAGTNQLYPTEQLPATRGLQGETALIDDLEIVVNGRRKPLEVHTIPVFTDSGNVAYVINAFQDITERRQAEKLRSDYERELKRWVDEKTAALRQSEERFRLAINHAPDVFVIYDRDRRYLYVNEKARERTGWTLDRFIGYRDEDLFAPELTTHYLPILQKTISTKKLQTGEFTVRLPRQKPSTFIVKYVPLLDEQGEIQQILGITFDISNRKHIEEVLRQSEARLTMAQRVAQVGSWEFDLENQNITWSEETFYHWGFDLTQGEPSYPELLQRVHPEDREILNQFFEQAIAQGIPFILDLRILRPDGSIRYLDYRGEPLCDAQGRVIKVIGTSIDISDHKWTEEALRQSEALNRAIVNALPDLMIRMHRDGTYLDVKPTTAFLTSASPLVVGQNVRAVLSPQVAQQRMAAIENALQTGEIQIYEFPFVVQGKSLWQEVRVTPLDADEVLVLIRDLTERKKAEEAIRLQAEREHLLRGITQRIRQSLDLGQILRTTVNEVLQTLQSDRALIFRLCEDGSGQVIQEAVLPEYPVTESMLFADESFPKECYEYYCQGQPRVVNDVFAENFSSCLVEFMREIGVKSKIVAPIVQTTENSSTKVWGLLIVHACSQHRQWQQSEANFLQQISNQLAIAIQQSQLYQQTRQQAQREQTLNRVVQAIRNSLDLDTIFATTVSEVGLLLQVMRVNIMQYLPERGVWVSVADYVQDPSLESSVGLEIPDTTNPIATKLKQFEIVQIVIDAPISEDEIAQTYQGACLKYQGACLTVPLKVEQQVWGSLTLVKDPPSAWQQFEVDLTIAVADQLAIAIQQANFYNQLQIELTERRQAEEALRRSEERFRKAFDNAPIGIALVSLSGQFLKVNASLCEIVGYNDEEMLALTFGDITHPDDLEPDLESRRQILASEIRVYQAEKRYIHSSGRTIQVLLKISLVRDQQRQPLYFIAQIQDISDRYKVNRMKDEFISIVSHELRTPLTAIRGSLGILEMGVLDHEPEQAKELLQIALNNSDRLVRLVNDILDLERLESGKVKLVMEACEVANLVRQATESVQTIADDADITLAVQFANIQIWVAPDAIVQTLINLLSNAIKFSSAGSTVWLRVEQTTNEIIPLKSGGDQVDIQDTHRLADKVTEQANPKEDSEMIFSEFLTSPPSPSPVLLFSVKDKGRGIPSDKLETIFERFQQVDVSDSRSKGGTGLGLAICKTIVQQHGGNIWVESSVGEGSTFYFTLPIIRK